MTFAVLKAEVGSRKAEGGRRKAEVGKAEGGRRKGGRRKLMYDVKLSTLMRQKVVKPSV